MNLKNENSDDPENPEPSRFVEIYSQSLAAEFKGLNEIAGIGFRRALEFLIKDFAIQEHPEQKELIIKAPLIQVITKLFLGDYLPIMERAAWLGNDETHYKRKHPDFGVQDLKNVIGFVLTDLDGKKQRESLISALKHKK